MAKVGRPTKYKKEYCELLIEHMTKGLSFESFGGVIGTHKKCLYDWAEKYPEFSYAKELGTEKSRLFWEEQGVEGLWVTTERNGNIVKTKSMNAAVWRMNMMNRFRWSDKVDQETQVSGKLTLSYNLEDEPEKK